MKQAIILGTAQFGMDYGLTNRAGQVPPAIAAAILREAKKHGVSCLDTAPAYENADNVLGALGETADFALSMKIGAQTASAASVDALRTEFERSLACLRRGRADILLLHRAHWLAGTPARGVRQWLEEEKQAGRIGAYGVSVYEPADLAPVLADGPVDWVQLPLSILDPRWWRDGHLERLRTAGIRVQLRSLLLQGLVLADPARLPPPLMPAREVLIRLDNAARRQKCSRLALALAFARAAPAQALVIGVTTVAELQACLAALQTSLALDWFAFACDDATVTDPRRWPAGIRIAA